MSENKKLELLDQYDDVTFALLMDEYAEEEGARLRKEFEEAQSAGEVSDTPDALDEKCLQMIHRDFAKKRGKENVRKIIRMTSKVAVAVMVFLGVMTMTVMSVDALRIPVMNFIIEQYDKYSSITTSKESAKIVEDPCVLLADLLPTGYTNTIYSVEEGMSFVLYQNDNGDTVSLSITMSGTEKNVDTEGANCVEILLTNDKALLIEKNGYQVIWSSCDGVTYNFRASNLTKNEVVVICNTLNAR